MRSDAAILHDIADLGASNALHRAVVGEYLLVAQVQARRSMP